MKRVAAWLSQFDWAALVGSALVLIFFALVVFPDPATIGSYQAAKQHATQTAPQVSAQDAAAGTVAYYTKVLAWFTAVLAIVSSFQLWLLRRSEDNAAAAAIAARDAADAAGLSAKAAIGVELPFLHIENVSFDNAFPATEEAFRGWCVHTSPKIKIKNYGRTPAFISSIIVNCKCGELPTTPEYEIVARYPAPTVIDGRGDYTYTEYLFDAGNFMSWEDVFKAMDKDTLHLHLCGVIKFSDFLGNQHQRGYIFTWSRPLKMFCDEAVLFPNYDYQT